MTRLRLRDEEGIALVMAVGIMLVISLTLVSIVEYTSANSRNASRQNADQKAYALAEAGLNNALAVLHAAYAAPEPHPLDCPAAAGSGRGVSFYPWPPFCGRLNPTTLLAPQPYTFPEGSVMVSGTYCFGAATGCRPNEFGLWKITSTASVKNPTGPGTADVTRTVRARIQAAVGTGTDPTADIWSWVYSGAPATEPCNTSNDRNTKITNQAVVVSPLYIVGNLCLNNQAKIREPGTGQEERLVVGGRLDLGNNQNYVGCVEAPDNYVATCASTLSSPLRLRKVYIVNGCTSKSDGNGNNIRVPCAGPGYDSVPEGVSSVFVRPGDFSTTMPPIVAPVIDPNIPYTRAVPGPKAPCTIASTTGSGTVPPPTFDNNGVLGPGLYGSVPALQDLTPASASYTCKTVAGELSWNHLTRVLTAKGQIYIDGSAKFDGGSGIASYTGRAAIFVSGTFVVKNIVMCAARNAANTDCDFTGWDPNLANGNGLTLAAFGMGDGSSPQNQVQQGRSIEVSNAKFQGLLYANHKVFVGGNTNTRHQGPVVTHETYLHENNTEINFPPMAIIPSGTPGRPEPPAVLGPMQDYSG